ncbi:MAG: glycerol-3-phosphate dehydrogenase [Betaproteobacteria bacterium]|nr:glycerol-3-phosphate dehydrogenase [Betaproteobacteria bacterium]
MTVEFKSCSAPEAFDVLVVGGGINGAGIARDLAGRGLKVMLCERDDLAAHTSSSSTKLIHGGLRYLEYSKFGLVRKSLQEREALLRSAPHIMGQMRFVLPHAPDMRPAWMIRAGLFIYDHLARRAWLPGSCAIDLRTHPAGAPLKPNFVRGFNYSDGWVDDARLVTLCAVDAAERGATVRTRTACTSAVRGADGWHATLLQASGQGQYIIARALVNATGPWAQRFLQSAVRHADGRAMQTHMSLRLVRGSHIVVPQLFTHPDAYILQVDARRVVFAIPYQGAFTLIGTTEVQVPEPSGAEICTDEEVAYLCKAVNRYFRVEVKPEHVVWRYAGVRPLLEDHGGDASAVTRDYRLEVVDGGAPLLTVWGGKITTFRKLSEQAADRLCCIIGAPGSAWTRHAHLPGGDLSAWIQPGARPDIDFAKFLRTVQQRYAWLPPPLAERLARAYGSRIDRVLITESGQPAQQLADLGPPVVLDVYAAEIDYLRREEWACSADDILWRRSKIGLHTNEYHRAQLHAWLAQTPLAIRRAV